MQTDEVDATAPAEPVEPMVALVEMQAVQTQLDAASARTAELTHACAERTAAIAALETRLAAGMLVSLALSQNAIMIDSLHMISTLYTQPRAASN